MSRNTVALTFLKLDYWVNIASHFLFTLMPQTQGPWSRPAILFHLNQEIIKVREVIPHTDPIPIVIPLRLFLDYINFPADNVTARVTWKFHGGGKVQQILYDATLHFQNWVSWPDKIHCLQDTGFKHTSLELLNCLVCSDTNLKNFQSIKFWHMQICLPWLHCVTFNTVW